MSGRSRKVYVLPPSVGAGSETARSGTSWVPANPLTWLYATRPSFVMRRIGQEVGAKAAAGTVHAGSRSHRTAAESGTGGAVPDRDRLHDVSRGRIDAHHAVSRPVARPQRSGAEGELGRGNGERLGGLATIGIDPRDRAVARVRDPDRTR